MQLLKRWVARALSKPLMSTKTPARCAASGKLAAMARDSMRSNHAMVVGSSPATLGAHSGALSMARRTRQATRIGAQASARPESATVWVAHKHVARQAVIASSIRAQLASTRPCRAACMTTAPAVVTQSAWTKPTPVCSAPKAPQRTRRESGAPLVGAKAGPLPVREGDKGRNETERQPNAHSLIGAAGARGYRYPAGRHQKPRGLGRPWATAGL